MEQTRLKYPFYCACAVVHDDDGPKALNYRVDDILVWVGCLPAFSSSLVPISSRKRRRGRHIIFVLVLLFVGEGERGPVSYVTPPVGWLVGSFVRSCPKPIRIPLCLSDPSPPPAAPPVPHLLYHQCRPRPRPRRRRRRR